MFRPPASRAWLARLHLRLGQGLLPGLALAACSPTPRVEAPSVADLKAVDPMVRERIDAGLAAVQRAEPGARRELAMVYGANGLPELALSAFQDCLVHSAGGDAPEARHARAELYYLIGQTFETLQQPADALGSYEAALSLGDEYGPTHWHAGFLLLDSGRVEEARAAFTRALALEPNGTAARRGLAMIQLLDNDPRAVIATLAPVVEHTPDEQLVHGLLARAYLALKDETRAEAELALDKQAKATSVDDPRQAELRAHTTGVLQAMREASRANDGGRPAAAVKILEEVHARIPEDLAVMQMLGKTLVSVREFDRAITVLEQAIAAYPDKYKSELFLGLALTGKGAARQALPHLEHARELNPGYGPTHAVLGEVQSKLGSPSEAEASLTRALELGETELRTHLYLARTQIELAAFDRAVETLRRTIAAYPRDVAARTFLAEAEARGGNTGAAREALAEAEKLDPKFERLAVVRALLDGKGAPAR